MNEINLQNIEFECLDFKQSILKHPNDFLYCDPPYYLEKNKSNLYGINGNMHRYFEHDILFNILSKRNNWILCYNDCERIRELYKNYDIVSLSWKYGLGNNKSSSEILIKNWK